MVSSQDGKTLPQLWAIMERLLAPDGCAWDRQQTPETLRNYVIEEAHEVVEAIDLGEPAALQEELGDLLFQIVFLAALAQRRNWFGLDDVVAGIAEKLERRHPHVFGDESRTDPDAIVARWEAIKREEKGDRPLLAGIPPQLPLLLRAHKVGQRAARVGLEFGSTAEARAKVFEEIAELDQALAGEGEAAAERELGDVLFSIVNWARMAGLDAESGLRGTVERFVRRFEKVEHAVKSRGQDLRDLDHEALDRLWTEAKARSGSE